MHPHSLFTVTITFDQMALLETPLHIFSNQNQQDCEKLHFSTMMYSEALFTVIKLQSDTVNQKKLLDEIQKGD